MLPLSDDANTRDLWLGRPWKPIDDWTLLVGENVAVHDNDRIVDRGTVDVVTGDGLILWLKQDGAVLRRVVEKIPGRNIRVLDTHSHE